jgi:ADP-heptose:LPS heptosyltransferase
MKPKMLVIELWGMGDLVLSTPFLKAAGQRFDITLLAKSTAVALQPRLWPNVEVISCAFPWTAFSGKYELHRWPWRSLYSTLRQVRSRHFDVGVSARWDPRDHLLLWLAGARRRIGCPRRGSAFLLTDRAAQPKPSAHRYESWQSIAGVLGIELPAPAAFQTTPRRPEIVLHSGAAHPVRVWPLERFHGVARRLRENGHKVRVACDPPQAVWWKNHAEDVCAPANISELIAFLEGAGQFIGNDSGPGHLAAIMGIPTFTIFGDNLPSRFLPLHPQAGWIDGKDCPFKPCSDSCHFAQPNCLVDLSEIEVWAKVRDFVSRNMRPAPETTVPPG